jgi:hypothetical protein
MRGIDITITLGALKALVMSKSRKFGRCRDFVSTWVAKLIGISGRTRPDELRRFGELGISFDVF